jgi:dsRNA-specific ribonuclease
VGCWRRSRYWAEPSLARDATALAYRRLAPDTVESLHNAVRKLGPELPDWVDRTQPWVARSCAVGKSLSGQRLPPRLQSDLFLQVLGVLCLADEYTVVTRLLDDILSRVQALPSTPDPKTELQKLIRSGTVSYRRTRTGPDHAPQFTVVVSDQRRRTGSGTGPNRKRAEREAALDFLRRHLPHALRRSSAGSPRAAPREIPWPERHVAIVTRLQRHFDLRAAGRPLLSQGLIHAAWTYENRELADACSQRDNQILAFVGSEQLVFEQTLAAARRAVHHPPEDYVFLNATNIMHAKVSQRSGVASGLLLGRGQAASVEMRAAVLQATVGAVCVALDFPKSLRERWPREWAALWPLIVRL